MEPVKEIEGRRWFLLDVNPEPWAIGPVSVGRRGGKVYPIVGRNQQLDSYKQAIAEELGDEHEFIVGPIQLEFYFWRNLAEYKTPQARAHRKHEADATNLQKATEDALQGILFKNDKDVKDVRSVIVEQGSDTVGRVLFSIRQWDGQYFLPPEIWEQINYPPKVIQDLGALEDDLSWPPKGSTF